MQASTGLASLLGAYNSDSDEEDNVNNSSEHEDIVHMKTQWSICQEQGGEYFSNSYFIQFLINLLLNARHIFPRILLEYGQ